MLTSLALIFLIGLLLSSICQKIKLPKIIGMLLTGIILGPFALNLLDSSILGISADLRKMALIIILIKAGLSLNINDLKKVGRPAIMLSFIPATFEMIAYIVFAPIILGITRTEAAVMGAVLSAVSPAVVVPRMVQLMDEKYGTNKSIPQMILAGASLDDVFVIVMFSTFIGMAQGGNADIISFLNIPLSIIFGILLGAITGYILSVFFELCHQHSHTIRNSIKVIIILSISFLLVAVEDILKETVSISGLIAVMSMACMLAAKSVPSVPKRIAEKYGKLWLAAEIILFVLVGAAVDIRYTLNAGLSAVIMIFIALFIRSIGVSICLLKTNLNKKERLFCVLAYLPKATVQAAIGSVPLSLGLSCGNVVLSVAVLGIIITAPLGAFSMDMTYRKFLTKE